MYGIYRITCHWDDAVIDCRTEFLPGCVVPTEKIAFSDPTPDGRAFAARYTRTQNFLVYRWL